MLRIFIKILFGVDMALGFLNYAAWSWLAGQRFNIWFLLLSVLSTHLPDLDFVPFLLLRRRFRLFSHWMIGHHPVPLLFLVAAAGFVAGKIWLPGQTGYLVGLTASGVFLHFLHDGMHRLGFPWLSPFSQTRYRFQRATLMAVPRAEIEQWKNQWQSRERSVEQEFSDRLPPLTPAQLLFWGTAALVVVVFAMRTASVNTML